MPIRANFRQPIEEPPTMTAFVRAALIRAARTAAQTAIAAIGAATVLTDIDWVLAGSTIAVATILSVLNSVVTGLPEAPPAAPES